VSIIPSQRRRRLDETNATEWTDRQRSQRGNDIQTRLWYKTMCYTKGAHHSRHRWSALPPQSPGVLTCPRRPVVRVQSSRETTPSLRLRRAATPDVVVGAVADGCRRVSLPALWARRIFRLAQRANVVAASSLRQTLASLAEALGIWYIQARRGEIKE